MVEVLLRCSTESCRNAPKTAPRPPSPGDKGEMQVWYVRYSYHKTAYGSVIPYHFNKLLADTFQKSTELGTHVRYVKCVTHMKYE